MKTITYEQFLEFDPCYLYDPEKKALMESIAQRREHWSAMDILELENIPAADRLWAVLREELIDAPILHEFACRCAERALSRIENPDPRSLRAIEVKRAWLRGKATDKELAAARAAAGAARHAAWAAAEGAAWAAAWTAAEDAAWDAAWEAARAAARDAAWDAAEAAAQDAALAARHAALAAAEAATWAAAEAAALAAAWAAALAARHAALAAAQDAAEDAAEAAERQWQIKELQKMLNEQEG